MARDPRAYLWEAHRAALLVTEFITDRTWHEYETEPMLRAAVERQFEIVGEALNQLSQSAPDVASQIPGLTRIVAFRNVLIHQYAAIDNRIVWEVATEQAGPLATRLSELLGEPS